MMLNATAVIEDQKQEINELNVFPVPDGDTGTNMSLTISAAEKALLVVTPATLGQAVDVTASALLRGARGNSGVILSLLFRGFAKRLKDVETADSATFAAALCAGVDSAYKAVMKPAEGTILTVSKLAAGAAAHASETEHDVEIVLEKALAAGYIALEDTINQNPVLKKAGVIDAGAKGYLYILDAMLRTLRGEEITRSSPLEESSTKADFAQFSAEEITFTYCTEFMVTRDSNKDPHNLRGFLDERGDSIVVVEDDAVIKVHIHTDEPGTVLTEALSYGALLSIKIENMREQHLEAMGESSGATRSVPAQSEPEPTKEFGIVAVCVGAGIEEIFKDLGADRIITGGQTMNPSTEDILEQITSAPSDVVFVLPNNKNIIMAAQQCIPLTSKRVIVLPTRSIPQGITALLSFDVAESLEDKIACMTEAAGKVHTALITKAARSTVFDGMKIKKGAHLALLDDSIVTSGSKAETVINTVAEALYALSPTFITIITGEDAKRAEIAKVETQLAATIPDAEITLITGGQPVYRYIIAAE